MAAPKKGRRSPAGQGKPWRSLALVLLAMVGLTAGMFASGQTTPRLGIDLAGGTSITLEAKSQPGRPDAINPTNMQTAVSIIERRVNGLGVSEAEVQTQGDRHIVVNIPRGTNEKQAREQVGTTAALGFRPVLSLAPTTKESQQPQPDPSAGEEGSKEPKKDTPPQGRAVTDGLKATAEDTPSPKATDKDGGEDTGKNGAESEQPATPPQQQMPQLPGVPKDLAGDLQKLDCTTPEARADASRKAASTKPGEPVVACDQKEKIKYALGPVAVKGKNVTDAQATLDQQGGKGWIVTMSFDDKGTKQFADITGKLGQKQAPQNQFAITLDGEVASAPSVSGPIGGGNAEISGSFTQQSSEDLANILSYGALPLSFQESDVTTVTPALGSDQLKAGLIAGAIGLALVVIYLLVYYRGLSLVALVSLVVAGILTYTIMSLLGPAIGFALNLPAVCGAIVAIGITADSFIVYFERVRDEIREGRTLRPAVERGWPRARRTILVSDFVSFLSAGVLFIVTVGQVQGFAFTLGLTTLLDVVIVLFVTKPLMTLLARKPFFTNGHPWSGLDPKRLGAKPPLRRGRRSPVVGTEPKEA